jgi:hypothetical protein
VDFPSLAIAEGVCNDLGVDSDAREIIEWLLGKLEDLFVESVAQRMALDFVCDDEIIDWRVLVEINKRDIAHIVAERFSGVRDTLLSRSPEDHRPLTLEKLEQVRRLIDGIDDLGERP